MNSSMTSSMPLSPSLDGLDYNSPAAEIRAEIKRLEAMEQTAEVQERIAELQGFLEIATEQGGPVQRLTL